jgi:hypothetical protein
MLELSDTVGLFTCKEYKLKHFSFGIPHRYSRNQCMRIVEVRHGLSFGDSAMYTVPLGAAK